MKTRTGNSAESHPALEQIDSRWIAAFRRKIKAWFAVNARELPWRGTRDAYRIWVSEIMLQQTQVATVIPYYNDFLNRYPDIESLAAADQSQVLRSWEGLGYYRRARQLHSAAKQIVADHGGTFPAEYAQVLDLPGIGRYTAGAILSFAHDQRLPILEANTTRLYARCMALKDAVEDRTSQNALWAFAEMILPRRECGDFNQALMELGSEVCTPRQPNCDACPLSNLCLTRIAGLQDQIPKKKPKKSIRRIYESVIVVRRNNRFLMRECGDNEWWTGMWDFPRYRVPRAAIGELKNLCREQTGLAIELGELLATIKHTVTHHNIELDCYLARSVQGRLKATRGEDSTSAQLRWVRERDLLDYPLSVTARKVTRLLEQ